MRSSVASALEERQVLSVLNRGRLGKPADRFGQQLCVVRHLDAVWNLRIGQRRGGRALGVDDRLFVLDLLPLERLLRPVGVEALSILPRGVEEAAGDFG